MRAAPPPASCTLARMRPNFRAAGAHLQRDCPGSAREHRGSAEHSRFPESLMRRSVCRMSP
eukprot:11799871-Alexandrium_andersonii.AAC.1